MKKLEHIGIAVKNLEDAISNYTSILGTPCYKREIVEEQKVETAFFQTGESKIELLVATSEESTIAKFIEKKGEGIHHMAFEVDDIESEIERWIANGHQPLSSKPTKGADNMLVVFLHPKEAHGTLIELCQKIKE